MSTATLGRMVRDPRSGQIHLPNERVQIVAVMRNVDRILLKVRWHAGGYCVVFPDELNESQCVASSERSAQKGEEQNLSRM